MGIGRTAARCCLTALAAVGLSTSALAASDLVISQVYGGGGNAGSQYLNDFIEVFNRGTTPISLNGKSVQYASAAGTTWAVTNLPNITLQPGGYCLVQEAAGTSLPAPPPLPTPDATGTIAMSSTNGKVALVDSTTALTGSCPTGAPVLDVVGYGSANCFEGAATGALSNTTAAIRNTHGCTDTDQNGSDFTLGAPTPRNSATALAPCNAITGACCIASPQGCSLTTQATCTGLGGSFLGQNTACDNNACNFPTGACCVTRNCSIGTSGACSALGGVYQGNNTVCGPNPCFVGCETIAQAEALATGTATRICNIVATNTVDLISSATSKNFQAQDATGGVTIFGTNAEIDALLASVTPGTQFDIEGVTGTFNGLFELVGPFYLVNIDGTPGVPAYDQVTSADFQDGATNAEFEESRIVEIHCVTFTDVGTFGSGVNHIAHGAAGDVIVRVSTAAQTDLAAMTIPTGPVDLRGVFSQFDSASPLDGGYQLLLTVGSDVISPSTNCPSTGGCCNGFTCSILTSAACTGGGGTFQGLGTGCTPNPCVPPTGGCCLAGACNVTSDASCTTTGGLYLGNNTTCPGTCPTTTSPAVQALDAAWGSNSTAPGSVHLVRGGSKIGVWSRNLIQSVEFDNAGGGLGHSPSGNLLGVDFGTACNGQPSNGMKIYNLATDGSDRSQLLFQINGPANAQNECSRGGGLSVSPDNTKAAVMGQANGTLYIMNYSAGGAIGTGTGASISGVTAVPTVGQLNISQGTAWQDNDHVLVADQNPGDPTQNALTQVTASTSAIVDLEFFPARGTTSQFTDVEYNPAICPYVFYLQSSVVTTPTAISQTTLWVLDLSQPQGSRVIKQVILDNSLQTGREIALANDNKLYISQFAGSTAPQPKVYIDVLDLDVDHNGSISAGDIAALTDDTSVDYYVVAAGADASFNGVDVALGAAVETRACCFANGTCQLLSQAACTTAGGTWGASGSNCTPNNCPPPTGRCCFANGLCQVATAAACTTAGGIAGAAGTNCSPNPCGCLLGDTNCDGLVNNFDIDAFVAIILDAGAAGPPLGFPVPPFPAGATAQDCWDVRSCHANLDHSTDPGEPSHHITNFDIDPFVACIIFLPPPGQACP